MWRLVSLFLRCTEDDHWSTTPWEHRMVQRLVTLSGKNRLFSILESGVSCGIDASRISETNCAFLSFSLPSSSSLMGNEIRSAIHADKWSRNFAMFAVEFLVGIVFMQIYECSFVDILFISMNNFRCNFGVINHKRFIISASILISASTLDFIFV